MYVVLIKKSAQKVNSAVASTIADQGERILFDSKSDAEQFAARLSRQDPRVAIQTAAPQDPSDANAYLVSAPRRYSSEPKSSEIEGLSFDVDANQYGELGEILVAGEYGTGPGIKYYLRKEYGYDDETYLIRSRRNPTLPVGISWQPDAKFEIRVAENWDLIETMYAEVKTGDASFQRRQSEAMAELAKEHTVLKIRVVIKQLPEEYTLRIEPIEASE